MSGSPNARRRATSRRGTRPASGLELRLAIRRTARVAVWMMTVALLGGVLSPAGLAAQLVRGRVTEQATGAPVTGALVELLAADSSSARLASVLSAPDGRYELRAPGPGRYRIAAKRIGVRRYSSAPFTLAAGETRAEHVVLAALDFRLPEVVVVANAACSVNPGDRDRVAALWEEARTALDAAEISLRDKLFTAEVSRYVRELDPKSMRVLGETTSDVRGVVASPFRSLPAESLSVVGYWRETPAGGVAYYGPDPAVLRSDVFLDDHCFRPVEGRGVRDGLIGLAFAPTGDRGVPDVTGTIWLDDTSFELRVVEFAYDRVGAGVDRSAIGGELRFARLPNGAWLVQRWYLRVPSLGRPAQPVATEGAAPWVLLRPTDFRLVEEGGNVTTDAMRRPVRLASITGVFRDSSGRAPIAGGTVRIGGSQRSATTDAAGRFTFDSLSPGPVSVIGRLPGYDALGLPAGSANVQLAEGETRSVTLTALDARALTERLCDGRGAPWGRGTVHATVRDRSTGQPVAGATATLRWMSTIGQQPGDSVLAQVDGVSDARGAVVFCEVASGRELTIEVVPPGSTQPAVARTTIEAREVRHVEVEIDGRATTG